MSDTELKVPSNAELVNGKWWTPKMVMKFWGYTPATYYPRAKGKTLRQMLYASHLRAQTGERSFSDRSQEFTVGGKVWSLAMIYYYMTKHKYIDPVITTYASFRGSCYSYMTRAGATDLRTGVDINCQRYGCNIWKVLSQVSQPQYDKYSAKYVEFINKHKKRAREELPPNFNPNDRYIECIQADPRMMHIYHKEVLERLPQAEREILHYRELVDRHADTILSLKHELATLQKQSLAKISRLQNEVELLNKELTDARFPTTDDEY